MSRGSGYPEYFSYGKRFLGYAPDQTTLQNSTGHHRDWAGSDNPTANYTKLKQKHHYQEYCYDVQC